MGRAWLRVDDLEVFYSTYHETLARTEKFGAEPASFECTGCGTSTNRTDLRFQGERTLAQFFSLQLSPYLLFVRQFFFISLLVGAAGYLVAKGTKLSRLPNAEDWNGAESLLLVVPLAIIAFWFVFFLILPAVGLDPGFSATVIMVLFAVAAALYAGYQLYGEQWAIASRKNSLMIGMATVAILIFIAARIILQERIPVGTGMTLTLGLVVFGFLYSVLQFVRGETKYATRGSTVLWVVALR
jgi:hypothetical protein